MYRLRLLPLALLLLFAALPLQEGIAGKLADDGRAAVVLEVQGTALVRPAGRSRWTPLGAKSVLFPGDVIQTRARGAHALELQHAKGKALLGPATELQLTKEGVFLLLRGEAEFLGTPEKALPVLAAGGYSKDVKGTAWLRAVDRGTTSLEKQPRWVKSYRASASDEWMGSLLAKVDGRDVPLAVGYHKVDVEVRDQIARTTVEQSFVNATSSQLEGVFYFPLPADASISGFGMWIGGELVEADIVERQRARQIYEDILRRKKDPGLLEWEGGNIFKARVFPIPAHAEKRIRIRYTQVLPLEGDTWRYRYALRSELLQSKPLRELQINVRVVSAQTMTEIASPTHEITLHNTGHEATATFRASEYRPKDDFEVAVKVERALHVTAIPHRRGDDGYFMLLLAPPEEGAGAWKRDLAPEGDPLHVILVADTSGSMDDGARAAQATFLDSLLSLLGPKDRFRLLAADATAEWITAEPAAVTEADEALAALAARRSLGWTDLDLALRTAADGAPENALVVYVGDGVSTTGNADPVAQAERIRAMSELGRVRLHAVAASSKYEAGVLRAMAEAGDGSTRSVGAHPARTAYDLLSEAARPSVRNLSIQIEGMRTARVYPRRLPNLPLGSQQVVLGRFLPTSEAQTGRVVVTGTLSGKPVRYTAALRIEPSDGGNSFLPRLWGRNHLDALLARGGSAENNEEIVAFSERFGIMTPLTSFLVLESDADRERYGVARRVRMRDGERFFADAKDKASLEQKRDLMRGAGRWRTALRRTALLEIARLGRDLPIQAAAPDPLLETQTALGRMMEVAKQGGPGIGGGGAFGGSHGADRGLRISDSLDAETTTAVWSGAEGRGSSDGGSWGGEEVEAETRSKSGSMPERQRGRLAGRPGSAAPATSPPRASAAPMKKSKAEADAMPMESPDDKNADGLMAESLEKLSELASGGRASARRQGWRQPGQPSLRSAYGRGGLKQDSRARPGQQPHFTLQSLGFPYVPAAPKPAGAQGDPEWNPEVLALLRSLPRRADLTKGPGGVHIVIQRSGLHATRGSTQGSSTLDAWLGAEVWHVKASSTGFEEPSSAWVHAGVRGVLAEARRLQRSRQAETTDGGAWVLPLWDLSTRDVLRAWQQRGYVATIKSRDGDVVRVALSQRQPHTPTITLDIDATRRVILASRHVDRHGKTTSTFKRSDFVEVAGRFWAKTAERYDAQERLIERQRRTIEAVDGALLEQALARAAKSRAGVLAVHGPLPTRAAAKQARHERKATFLDALVIALHLGQQQRAKESFEAWTQAEEFVRKTDGAVHVRTAFLSRNRRGEDFKGWLKARASALASQSSTHARFFAGALYHQAASIFGPHELAAYLESVRSAWTDAQAGGAAQRERLWWLTRLRVHESAGQTTAARGIRAELAKTWPHEVFDQLAYEADLWATGRYDEALRFAETLLAEREPWLGTERDQIYTRLTDRLWNRRELKRLHATLLAWTKTASRQQTAWWRYLSSFYYLGDMAGGDGGVLAWLGQRLSDRDGEDRWAAQAAAVRLALGSGWNFHAQRIEPGFETPLRDLAASLVRTNGLRVGAARSIMTDWRFRRTDASRTLVESLYADLEPEGAIAELPLHRLARYMGWLGWQRGAAPDALWQSTVARIRTRWTASEDAHAEQQLAGHVLALLDARGMREDAIVFVREAMARAKGASEDRTRALARDLFRRLLQTPDLDAHATTQREDECFALLPALVDPDADLAARRRQAATDVRTLADRLHAWRMQRGMGTLESRSELTRAALAALRRAVLNTVRSELAERLRRAEGAAEPLYKPWLQIERLGYAVEHGADLEAIVAEATAVLRQSWPREGDPLDRLLRERAATVLAYAATRTNAPAGIVAAVLATFREGEDLEAKAKAADPDATALLDWRYHTWRLLLARDDAAQLEERLTAWIVPAQVESRWRIALGYLLAETGRVAPAAEQFQAVHALDELEAPQYAVLADWYLVLGDDARRTAALAGRYERMNENQLSSALWQRERAMSRRGGVPGDFEPESLLILKTLMRKAQHPANYVYRVRNLYMAIKDFRLLESMADGLIGHTKEGIYGMLSQMTQLTGQVHEEATLDEWTNRLKALSAADRTPLDRRALLLATALVEARASLVPETDPAHGKRAVAAMRAAYQQAWQTGEREHMAGFLQRIGVAKSAGMRKEQLRQLADLVAAHKVGTPVRLRVADAYAQTLWAYGKHGEAVDLLETELQSLRAAYDGRVPMHVKGPFDRYVNWLSHQGRFPEAERVLLGELAAWDLPMRRRGLQGRLFNLYVEVIRRKGSVSLGRGAALFKAAARLMEHEMRSEPAYASTTLNTYAQLHRRAQESGAVPDAGALLEDYARGDFQALLARMPINATNYVSTLGNTIRALRGPTRGLAFLLDRHDSEPRWLDRLGYGIWQRSVYHFARWRKEAGDIGPLAPRLLKLVVAQIETNLTHGGSHGSYFWGRHKWAWPEQFGSFADAASRVAELNESSEAIIVRCAQFLRGRVGRRAAGVDMLAAAHARGLLSQNARWTLAVWHKDDRAYAKSLVVIDELIAERAQALAYRIHRVVVLAKLGRMAEARTELTTTETLWREGKRWSEGVAAQLGAAAARHDFPALAEGWMEEAIRMRQEARGNRGGRDSTLSRYYRALAEARGKLQKTDLAVHAASAAILSANPRRRNELQESTQALLRSLRAAKSLPGYLETYDAQVEESGLDAPILRKAFATIFEERKQYAAAIEQLLLARELDPYDGEVHTRLVRAYDANDDAQGAVDALFGSIRLAPQNVEAYVALAERYRRAGDATGQERALTTLAEASPHQAEGHRALAVAREKAKRMPEAAEQWRQVVRTERLDPTGYLSLARALIGMGDGPGARETLEAVIRGTWEARFGKVKEQAAAMLGSLEGK